MTPQPSTLAVGTRVASFDIGSNTVIMLIAERGAEGWQVVTDEAEITRVSEGLDKHGSLFREGLERTAEALIRFDELAQDFAVHHRIATGTAPSGGPPTVPRRRQNSPCSSAPPSMSSRESTRPNSASSPPAAPSPN